VKINRKIYNAQKIKHLLFILSMAFIFLSVNSGIVNAEASDSAKINFLIQRGATQDILEKLSQERLDSLYDKVVEEDLYCKAYETVIKETPSMARRSIDLSELELVCLADFYIRSDNTVSWAVVEYQGKWAEGKPYIWGEDVVTFNWDSDKFICDFSEFYSEYYIYGDENTAHTAYFIENPAQAALQGLGYYVNLQRFDYKSYEMIKHAIRYRGFHGVIDLAPSDTVVANKNMYLGTTLKYAHNKNPLPISISVSITGVNVAIKESVLVDAIDASFAFALE